MSYLPPWREVPSTPGQVWSNVIGLQPVLKLKSLKEAFT